MNVGLFGTGPFGDSLLGILGTLYWALSGQFTGPFRDSFGSHINFLSKLSPKGPLGYWAFWGHFLDPRFIRWISALSERNDKSDVVGFA